jgi:maltose O-acetyltransferase
LKHITRTLSYILFVIIKYVPNLPIRSSNVGQSFRRFVARGFLEHCGEGANIEYGASFHGRGRGVRLGRKSGIGVRAHIGPYVSIGDFVMMGPEVVILTRNHKFSDTAIPICEQGYEEYRPVIVEDDVWIGQRVIILPGVRIGRGTIVGAGSVVAKDIPEWSVAVGNPCRIIKKRMEGGMAVNGDLPAECDLT